MTTTTAPVSPSVSAADPFVRRLQTIQHLISSGKLSEAADRLNAASRSSPRDARVYILASRLAEAAGNAAGAQDAARKAVGYAPDWPPGVTELAFLLARQNQLREAVEVAKRAVQLDGSNPEVLARVIDIAHRAQHFDLALTWLQRAAMVAPDNVLIKRLLARDLRLTGQNDKALAAYNQLVTDNPADAEALLGRLQTALALGDAAHAQKDAAALLALHPGHEEFAFWSTLAHGQTPPRLPASMVRAQYDGLADLFDQHVVAGLKYKLPREVAAHITARWPDKKLNVLDLGSGTGLLGVALGRIDGAMVGVELSPRMIEQAARHNVYDRFHNVDLLDALQATPEALYDVLAALDVFIYVGDLKAAIPDALRILKPGGEFIFSCETAGKLDPALTLLPSQRYAHQPKDIERQCRAAGFADVTRKDVVLRYENNEPVAGFLVVATKAA